MHADTGLSTGPFLALPPHTEMRFGTTPVPQDWNPGSAISGGAFVDSFPQHQADPGVIFRQTELPATDRLGRECCKGPARRPRPVNP